MIERYVFIRLKEPYGEPDNRAQLVARSKALATLPGVRSLRVGSPADDRAQEAWDISLALTFDDLEAVETYRLHPEHRAYVDDFLTPRLAAIKAWNFEV